MLQTTQLRPAIFIFIFFPVFLFGQKNEFGNVKGKITTTDDQPAERVSVQVKKSTIGTTTDENGNFEIRKIKPGQYILQISLLGYSDQEIAVTVKQNEDINLNIQLKQTYAELKNIILDASKQSKYVETKISEGLRLNLPLVEIPQNIQTTSRQLLSDEGLIAMTEALRTVSGIQKYYGGLNDYQLIIRGTIGQFNVLRNGVAGFWWNQQEDAEMLEKIEFSKGPSSFMMSMMEPGGIVNNVTKQPVKEKVASINAGFGSYNLFRLATDLGGAFSKKSN